MGKAPKASFHLFRTEDVTSEHLIEEHNWVCGAERADSVGTDLISSSVGYTIFDIPGSDHPYSDRNGDIAMATIGADLAAKKGILVFNAQGNIIDASTQFLSVPADGDSVVAVGSVSSAGVVASNSSYGPAADGRIKPDLASVGVSAVVQSSSNTISTSSGTSFACPNMAGLASCLWQGFPEYSNMKIVYALRLASSKYANPDDRVGYGIPNLKTAFQILLVEYASSSATINACTSTVSWSTKDVGAMKYEIERRLPGEANYTKVGDLDAQAGNILAPRNYQFSNAVVSPTPGTISYRIRQIIDTAAASFTAFYIDTANVSIASGCLATGTGNPTALENFIFIQPNPVASNQMTLVVETTAPINNMPIIIYDNKGRSVLKLQHSKASGRASFEIPLTGLAAGKYYITVFDRSKKLGTAELIRL